MSATKIRDSVISVNLTTSCVSKAIKSYNMSKRYINTMMKATIINILYHRLNIDQKEFVTKIFNNVSFKTFKAKSHNIYIREFHTYMLACKDALDKGYLREFYMYFIDVASGDIVENYKFSFQYNDHKEAKHDQNEGDLVESTCELLNTLEELRNHEKLDAEMQVKVEFTYFDDTPEDYEPPGFRNVDEDDSFIKKLNKKGNSVLIGTLFTGFHKLKCRGKGDVFNFNSSATASALSQTLNAIEDVANATEATEPFNPQVATDNDNILTEDFSQPIAQNHNEKNLTKTTSGGDNQHQSRDQSRMNDTYLSQYIEVSSDEEAQIDCPCKLPILELYTVDEIHCGTCKRVFHAPCQGYLDNTFVLRPFRCSHCRDDADSIVALFDVKRSMSTYRVRFILAIMYKYGKIPTEFKSTFESTLKNFETLKIFEYKENKIVAVNIQILNGLFKFDFKMPDVDKFKGISKL